ncbi:MAG: hypothetical protein IT303_17095 [Dehalococcoidia bacterium]|nr:hypothetical protein [Dehalococcoidia bacterium]
MDRMNRLLFAVGAPVGLAVVLGGAVAFAANSGGEEPTSSGRLSYQEGEEATPEATPKSHRGGKDCPEKDGSGGGSGTEDGTVSPSAY